MSKLEGELHFNELGQILIDERVISAGSIIAINIKNEWVEVCIEEANGLYYPIPMIDLKQGLIARIQE